MPLAPLLVTMILTNPVVAVTGGRFWKQQETTWAFLDHIHDNISISALIHGAARGADTLCGEWAKSRSIPVVEVPIGPDDWNKSGALAVHRRNQDMIDLSPDCVIAFPGESGTADMIKRAKRAGIEIYRWCPHY